LTWKKGRRGKNDTREKKEAHSWKFSEGAGAPRAVELGAPRGVGRVTVLYEQEKTKLGQGLKNYNANRRVLGNREKKGGWGCEGVTRKGKVKKTNNYHTWKCCTANFVVRGENPGTKRSARRPITVLSTGGVYHKGVRTVTNDKRKKKLVPWGRKNNKCHLVAIKAMGRKGKRGHTRGKKGSHLERTETKQI